MTLGTEYIVCKNNLISSSTNTLFGNVSVNNIILCIESLFIKIGIFLPLHICFFKYIFIVYTVTITKNHQIYVGTSPDIQVPKVHSITTINGDNQRSCAGVPAMRLKKGVALALVCAW